MAMTADMAVLKRRCAETQTLMIAYPVWYFCLSATGQTSSFERPSACRSQRGLHSHRVGVVFLWLQTALSIIHANFQSLFWWSLEFSFRLATQSSTIAVTGTYGLFSNPPTLLTPQQPCCTTTIAQRCRWARESDQFGCSVFF